MAMLITYEDGSTRLIPEATRVDEQNFHEVDELQLPHDETKEPDDALTGVEQRESFLRFVLVLLRLFDFLLRGLVTFAHGATPLEFEPAEQFKLTRAWP